MLSLFIQELDLIENPQSSLLSSFTELLINTQVLLWDKEVVISSCHLEVQLLSLHRRSDTASLPRGSRKTLVECLDRIAFVHLILSKLAAEPAFVLVLHKLDLFQ